MKTTFDTVVLDYWLDTAPQASTVLAQCKTPIAVKRKGIVAFQRDERSLKELISKWVRGNT